MNTDHLELTGEAYAGLIDASRTIFNVMFHNKENIPEACYEKVLEELGKLNTIVRNIVIVKGKPHDFNVHDFDSNGAD